MRSMRILMAAGVLMACVAGGTITVRAADGAAPAARAAAAPRAAKSAGNATRQFTGWVTAVDNASLTVERRGKQPRTMVFTRHARMTTQAEVGKDAHVTVYYRDDGGQLTAHRVIVKPLRARDPAAGAGGGATRGGR